MDLPSHVSKTIGFALLATTVVIATGAALVLAVDFVLLIFLAILFGVFLTKTSQLLDQKFSLGYAKSLALITVALVAMTIGSLLMFGVNIEQQLDKTSAQLDKSSDKLNQWLDEHPLLKTTFRRIPFATELVPLPSQSETGTDPLVNHIKDELTQPDQAKGSTRGAESKTASVGDSDEDADAGNREQDDNPGGAPANSSGSNGAEDIVQTAAGQVFAGLGRLLSTTLGAVVNIGIVFFMGIFIAIDPTLYRDGIVWLFPKNDRERVTEVLNKIGDSMFKWLNGRFLAMFITGAGTAIALLILGVPMAITVGVITGLLTFVPNIGAIIALVIAMLLALTVSPMTVLWVAIIYGCLQLIESNVITPIVQQHQTSIPPALLIGFQILMGALTGFLGVMVSTPLLAAGMVGVKELWIKDTLNDDSFEAEEKTDSKEIESAEQGSRMPQQKKSVADNSKVEATSF